MRIDLEKDIEMHLATFPERHNDVKEMQKEWREYKVRAFYILIGFVASILSIGIWVGTMQANIEQGNDEHNKLETRYALFEQRLGILEVTNGEIRARLSSIDIALQEIKVSVSNIPR